MIPNPNFQWPGCEETEVYPNQIPHPNFQWFFESEGCNPNVQHKEPTF